MVLTRRRRGYSSVCRVATSVRLVLGLVADRSLWNGRYCFCRLLRGPCLWLVGQRQGQSDLSLLLLLLLLLDPDLGLLLLSRHFGIVGVVLVGEADVLA